MRLIEGDAGLVRETALKCEAVGEPHTSTSLTALQDACVLVCFRTVRVAIYRKFLLNERKRRTFQICTRAKLYNVLDRDGGLLTV